MRSGQQAGCPKNFIAARDRRGAYLHRFDKPFVPERFSPMEVLIIIRVVAMVLVDVLNMVLLPDGCVSPRSVHETVGAREGPVRGESFPRGNKDQRRDSPPNTRGATWEIWCESKKKM